MLSDDRPRGQCAIRVPIQVFHDEELVPVTSPYTYSGRLILNVRSQSNK